MKKSPRGSSIRKTVSKLTAKETFTSEPGSIVATPRAAGHTPAGRIQDALSRDTHLILEAPDYMRRSESILECLHAEAVERGEVALFAVSSQRLLSQSLARAETGMNEPLEALDGFECPARIFRRQAPDSDADPAGAPRSPPQSGRLESTHPADCLGLKCPFASECPGLRNQLELRPGVRLTTHRTLFQWLRYGQGIADGTQRKVTMVALDDADLALDTARIVMADRVRPSDLEQLPGWLVTLGRHNEGEVLKRCIQCLASDLIETGPTDSLRSTLLELLAALEEAGEIFLMEAERQLPISKSWAAWLLDARLARRMAEYVQDAIANSDPRRPWRVARDGVGPFLISDTTDQSAWLASTLFGKHRSVIVAGSALKFAGKTTWMRRAFGVPDQAITATFPIPPHFLRATQLVVPTSSVVHADPLVSVAVGLERLVAELRRPILACFNSTESRDYALQPTQCGAFGISYVDGQPNWVIVEPRTKPGARHQRRSSATPACLFLEGLELTAAGHALTLTDEEWADDGFVQHILPRAVLQFRRQLSAFYDGDLRSRILVVNDIRVLDRGYAAYFLKGLEEMPLARDFSELTMPGPPDFPAVRGRTRRRARPLAEADGTQIQRRLPRRPRQLNLFPRSHE